MVAHHCQSNKIKQEKKKQIRKKLTKSPWFMSANKNARELSWLSDILDTKIDKNIFIRKKKIKMLPWPIIAKFDTSYRTLYITKQGFFSITSKKCLS